MVKLKLQMPILQLLPILKLQFDIEVSYEINQAGAFQYPSFWTTELEGAYSHINAVAYDLYNSQPDMALRENVLPLGVLFDVELKGDFSEIFYVGVQLDADLEPASELVRDALVDYDQEAFNKLAETL